MSEEKETTKRARAMHEACLGAMREQRIRVRDHAEVKRTGHALAQVTGTVQMIDLNEYTALERRCAQKRQIVRRVRGQATEGDDRHHDALSMTQGGACNPSGILRSVVKACEEIEAEGGDPGTDDAVRLMMVQVTWIVDCAAPKKARTAQATQEDAQAVAA